MNRKRLRHAQAVLGVAVLLAGIAAASPAAAAEEPKQDTPSSAPAERPPGGFSSWEELSEAQNKLNSAADQILAGEVPGYSSLIAAPQTGMLQIYWKGAVPADVQDRAKATGVPVKFNPARFSELELAEEITRLSTDRRVFTAAPNADGSGITATVGTDADRQAVLAEARLTMSVNVESRGPQLLYDRQKDIPWYWGGARWDNTSTGSYCSTGFGINFFGQRMMLSAAHCGNPGQGARVGMPGQPINGITMDVNPRDTLMINRVGATNYDGRIYSGGIYNNSSYKVIGGTSDYIGNFICTGGARTGEHCNATVQAVNVTVLGILPLIYAAAAPNTCIAAPGDSGGPAYSLGLYVNPWPNLQLGAIARGTITAGYTDTPCVADSGSRNPPPILTTGSYRVYYAPVLRPTGAHIGSLQFYGASLL